MMESVHKALLSGRQLGFTLVELLVVLVIVAIIAAIGYPSYVQYTIRANRTAAQSFMLTIANKQEQYMLDARSYANDPNALTTLGLTLPIEVSRNYDVAVSAVITATPPTYTITATRISPQQINDSKCGNLTLNQTGLKGTSALPSPVAGCW